MRKKPHTRINDRYVLSVADVVRIRVGTNTRPLETLVAWDRGSLDVDGRTVVQDDRAGVKVGRNATSSTYPRNAPRDTFSGATEDQRRRPSAFLQAG